MQKTNPFSSCTSLTPPEGREVDPDMESDRFRFLSPGEQRIAAMFRDGEDVVDRHGRARIPLGSGPMSQLTRAIYPVQQPREKSASNVITLSEFQRAYEAVALANVQGLMLNTFLTVSWTVGGVNQPAVIDALHDRLFANMRAWAVDRGIAMGSPEVPFAAIWVKEVGKKLGLHSHFLLHVPPPLFMKFRTWAYKATRRLLELPKPDPRMARSSLQLVHCSPLGDQSDGQWRVFRYLMKGIDPDMIINLDASHKQFLVREFAALNPRDQGLVTGARFGRSRSLGPDALREAQARYGQFIFWTEDRGLSSLPYDGRYLNQGHLHRTLLTIEI